MADENYTIVTRLFAKGDLKVIEKPILVNSSTGGSNGISPIAAAITALVTRGRGKIKQPTAAKIPQKSVTREKPTGVPPQRPTGNSDNVPVSRPEKKSAATGSTTSAIKRQAEARGVTLPKEVFEKPKIKEPTENKFRVGGKFDNDLTLADEVQRFRESAAKIPGALSPQADLKLKNFVQDNKKQMGEIDVLKTLEESGSVEKLTPEITEMKKTQINTQQLDSGVQ